MITSRSRPPGAARRIDHGQVCRTRQAKGARACSGQRIPADDLGAAVGAELLEVFTRVELFEKGVR
jgi:hypothetical protein